LLYLTISYSPNQDNKLSDDMWGSAIFITISIDKPIARDIKHLIELFPRRVLCGLVKRDVRP
jgi:hypothetical protein